MEPSSWFSAKKMGPIPPGEISLAYLPPTPRQSRLALAGAAVLLLGLAALTPFAAKPLPQFNGFIPALDATIFVTEIITASLLFVHFSVTRSRALLVLACGYLFSALIVAAHGLTFPEAFLPTGNPSTNVHFNFRVYLFWHLGLPVSLFAYVRLRDKDYTKVAAQAPIALMIICSVAGVLALAGCALWLAAAGDVLLPSPPNSPNPFSYPAAPWLIDLTMLICAAALLVLWAVRRSLLDQWLMVVVLASMIELAITGRLGWVRPFLESPGLGSRFTLGFYTGRVLFSLITSTVVLTALLAETTRLYARLARANMLAELAHANRIASMGQLTASIAHEVNQPIAALLTNAETTARWLERQPPNLEKAKQSIDRIVSDGKRAADIVSRIRDFSRKSPVRTESLQMNEAILEVMGLSRASISEHGVLADVQLSEGLPHILGDRVQLQQVILNLIMNAIEAMSEVNDGLRELLISTSESERATVLVKISDTGPGLSSANPERIFEAFYSTKATGLGMGLSICRSIVEAHGGRLWATPNESRGATFCVMLPVREPAA